MADPRDFEDASEVLLRRLAVGDLDADAPEVVAAFEQDPELARRWRAFERRTRQLDAAGRLARAVAADDGDVPGLDWDAVVRRVVAEETPARPRLRGPRWPLRAVAALAAAALLLLVLLPGTDPPRREDPGDVRLGADASELPVDLAPDGELPSAALEVLTWRYAPPAAWSGDCRVEVLLEDGTFLTSRADRVERTDEEHWTWTPATDELERMRAASGFTWEVLVEGADGAWRLSEPASVSLR